MGTRLRSCDAEPEECCDDLRAVDWVSVTESNLFQVEWQDVVNALGIPLRSCEDAAAIQNRDAVMKRMRAEGWHSVWKSCPLLGLALLLWAAESKVTQAE